MTPPHTRFKYLFRKHMWLHSRHSLDRAEVKLSSTETVSPAPQGGFNQGFQLPEPSPVSCVDCTSSRSGSGHFSSEQGTQAAVASFEHRESEPGAIAAGGQVEDRDVGTIPVLPLPLPILSLPLPIPSLPLPIPSLPLPIPPLSLPIPLPSLPVPSPPLLPNPTSTLTLMSPVLSTISSASTNPTIPASLVSATTPFTSSKETPSDGISLSSMITSPTHTVFTHTTPITTRTPITLTHTASLKSASTPLTLPQEVPSGGTSLPITKSIPISQTSTTPLLSTTGANHETTSKLYTALLSSTSTAYSSSPSNSNSCLTSADGTSGCSAVDGGDPSGSSSPSLSSNPCTDCPSSSSSVSQYSLETAHVSNVFTTTTAITTPLLPVISTVSSTSTATVPTPSASDDNVSTPPAMGAIAGGTIGAVALLGILIYIIMRCRSNKMFAVTPFDFSSSTAPLVNYQNLKHRSRGRSRSRVAAVRPSSSASSFVQYSDACLAEFESRSAHESCMTPNSASFMYMSDEDEHHASASTIARRHRAYELEKLYPLYPSPRVRTTGYGSGEENWVGQMVTADRSREPSEELPAYPRSAKSLKSTSNSREADRGDHDDGGDDHFVLPSSYPSLPETMRL